MTLKLSRSPVGTPAEEAAVEQLTDRIDMAVMGIGESIGYDVEKGEATIYVEGDDAERLCDIMVPLARAFPWGAGSYVVVRDADGQRRLEL